MDIAVRKLKLLEKFLKVVNEKNVSHFEAFIEMESIPDDTVVAHTINGTAVSKEEYSQKNQRAIDAYQAGNFKTSQQLKEKYKAN